MMTPLEYYRWVKVNVPTAGLHVRDADDMYHDRISEELARDEEEQRSKK